MRREGSGWRKEKKPEGGASWSFQKKGQTLSNTAAEWGKMNEQCVCVWGGRI